MKLKDHKTLLKAKTFDFYVDQYRYTGIVEDFGGTLLYSELILFLPMDQSLWEEIEIKEERFKHIIDVYCALGKIHGHGCDDYFGSNL